MTVESGSFFCEISSNLGKALELLTFSTNDEERVGTFISFLLQFINSKQEKHKAETLKLISLREKITLQFFIFSSLTIVIIRSQHCSKQQLWR